MRQFRVGFRASGQFESLRDRKKLGTRNPKLVAYRIHHAEERAYCRAFFYVLSYVHVRDQPLKIRCMRALSWNWLDKD